MVRDPLYRKIWEKLGGPLDPIAFERCAVELLRDVYPGLAPITGGDDAGMDGAIPNAVGEQIPLIATTRRDVIGNLTSSLKSYRAAERSATEAVVATSQALTPRRRRNLEARAEKLGFTLSNIHDRHYFTGELYRNPKWRLELLGLPGDPPALSALPRLPGPHRAGPLVGRDEELAWLRGHRTDALLVGQPGVGKTALLAQLASEGHGLFAVSEDPGQIADAFRDNPVRFVFVDDGHLRESLLDLLLRLREELGFDFGIVASTWPSRGQSLALRLFVDRSLWIQVGGLPRETVAEIIRREEPDLPDAVIGDILDQSEDPPEDMWKRSGPCRPGLALTLARYAARLGVEALVRGDLLLEGLQRDFRALSDTGLHHLATLAMGGGSGMRLSSAARALQLPEATLSGSLEVLAGTGTLSCLEPPYRRQAGSHGPIVVRPAALRHALVARTYFSGGLSLSIEPAFEAVEDAVACTETLLGALARGARVSHQLLQHRLKAHTEAGVGSRVLDVYAATGAEGALWVLKQHPHRASSVASMALRFAPEPALRRLLTLATASDEAAPEGRREAETKPGDGPRAPERPEDLVSVIGTWVRAGRPGLDAVTRRRALIAALTERGGSYRGGSTVLAGLVRACFSLGFMAIEGDSVSREKFRMPMGSLTARDVAQLATLWPEAMRILPDLDDHGLACVRDVIREWVAGVRIVGKRPETKVASRAEVSRMLELALDAWGDEPGFLHWARGIVREHALDVEIGRVGDATLSRWIDSLYPPVSADRDAWRRMTQEQRFAETGARLRRVEAAASRLAGAWSREKPATVVDRMLELKRQAEFGGRRDGRPTNLIAGHLGELVGDPRSWLEACVAHGTPEEWVRSFLAAAVLSDPGSVAPWKVVELHDPDGEYAWACLQVGVRLRNLPPLAVSQVLLAARRHADSVREAVWWTDVPDEWVIRFLGDRNDKLRGETAFALWELHGRRRPPGDVGVLWEDAAVTCGSSELLHDVFNENTAVAVAWLIHAAEEDSRRSHERRDRSEELWQETGSMGRTVVGLWEESDTLYRLDTELLAAAVQGIGREDRRKLLQHISAEAHSCFFMYLAGDDPELEPIARERGHDVAGMEPVVR